MTWDPTISLGSMMAAASILIGILGVGWTNSMQLRVGLRDIAEMLSRIQRVEVKVEHIAVMQQQLVDGKERMDSLDERLRVIERAKVRAK